MANLQTRVVNILKSPKTEWPAIAAESTDVGRLYREYIVLLAAIPAVAGFIGMMWFTSTLATAGLVRRDLMWTLSFAIGGYVLGLVGVYIAAVVIEWLAPKFKSSGTRVDALKVVAYSFTPVWIAGILQLVPLLGILSIFAVIYAVYLCYLGLPHLMKTPQDQVVIFMIVSALVIVVIQVVLGAILGAILMGGAMTTVG